MAKRGAKSIFENKARLVAALKGIKGAEGYAQPSYYHLRQLAKRDLVAFDVVKHEGRGRPRHQPRVTARGQAVINFNPKV